MEPGEVSILAILVAFLTSGATVFVTDYIGLRRDRAKLRMEFGWQILRQQWDALYEASNSCPKLSSEGAALINSVVELTTWSQAKVEPWMDESAAEDLQKLRNQIDEWVSNTIRSSREDPNQEIAVPSEKINRLRSEALSNVAKALRGTRERFRTLSKQSKL